MFWQTLLTIGIALFIKIINFPELKCTNILKIVNQKTSPYVQDVSV